jgi:hypothetical protein
MLHSSDRPRLADTMQPEMEGLRDILEIVLRAHVPAHIKILPAVWAFK